MPFISGMKWVKRQMIPNPTTRTDNMLQNLIICYKILITKESNNDFGTKAFYLNKDFDVNLSKLVSPSK